MASRQLDEEAIFHVARDIANAETRSRYLDQVCAGDQPLRERVEALVEVNEKEQHFLKSSPDEPAATVDQSPLTERPGSTIGRYRLMEQVGEGGMGVVFVAEQERPVRRKVALKIIKPGMDTKEVVARFEAERQALALMDHPNIAKVFDAGSTDSGRPYFVMELVRGIPITEYCDQTKLTIRERLDLFIQVCQAIQHAHQKGIIHRDVKPSNVLVTLHDGKPVPKVIDFGVAKATNQRLTERTIYTRLAQIIGTPMYMSPEQAELSGLDVDTRSDVYSLGVLLYELLTGTTPFDKERFEKAAYDEIRRIVREEEPPRPSTKISTLGETATSVSQHRGTDPHGLSRSVRGDLDVIVMKSIEKDRTRRYDTVSGLGADVQRFLNDEPIIAKAPSLAYRFRKFTRRNRAAVAMSAIVLSSIVVGIVAIGWMAKRAWDQKERAEGEARRANETLKMLAEASYESAVSAILAGDREKTDKALEMAKRAGVPRTRLAVLNGLMAVMNFNVEESLKYADEAREYGSSTQQSDRIGVSALATLAALWGGDLVRWDREHHLLRQLTPATETDHLLMAHARQIADPLKALSLLERKPTLLRSPAGVLERGTARYFLALDRRDAKLMDDAIRDVECVLLLHGGNQSALAMHAAATAWAIDLARLEGRDEDVARYANRGRPSAERLEFVTGFRDGLAHRWLFCRAIGDVEKATQALRGVGHQFPFYLSADCLRRQDATAAVEEFDTVVGPQHQHNTYVRVAKAYLVRDLPDGAQQVHDLVDNLLNDPSPTIQYFALTALCLVDSPRAIQARVGAAIGPAPPQYLKVLGIPECKEFLAGRLDEQQLLNSVGTHSIPLSVAHFTIGMMRLAEGNRQQAHENFGKCVATNAIGSYSYDVGRAYLARMDADPNWPSWIRENTGK